MKKVIVITTITFAILSIGVIHVSNTHYLSKPYAGNDREVNSKNINSIETSVQKPDINSESETNGSPDFLKLFFNFL